MIKQFETILLEEAFEFVQRQELKVRKKIFQNIKRAEFHRDPKFFKKLTNEVWEFRTLFMGIQYRLLAFWDKDDNRQTLVIAAHGFVKKTSKVDRKEIDKVLMIRDRYFKEKGK